MTTPKPLTPSPFFLSGEERWRFFADGTVGKYPYHTANHLTEVQRWSDNTVTATLEYDADYGYNAFGLRVIKVEDKDGAGSTHSAVTSKYEIDGWNPATSSGLVGRENFAVRAKLDGSNAVATQYLLSDKIDDGLGRIDVGGTTEVRWTLTDFQKSVRTILDGTGAVIGDLAYDAFGNKILETASTTSGEYGYTGREWDKETELQYNRARWYDPKTARWLTQDPLGFDAGDTNLYRYVSNRATGAVDPSGLDDLELPVPNGLDSFSKAKFEMKLQGMRSPVGPRYNPSNRSNPSFAESLKLVGIGVPDPPTFRVANDGSKEFFLRYDLADDATGPSDRIMVRNLKQIAADIERRLKSGDSIKLLQIGSHGLPGIINRHGYGGITPPDDHVFSLAELQTYFQRKDKNLIPEVGTAFKRIHDDGEALAAIARRMSKNGKVEFLGCDAFQGEPGQEFQKLFERFFGEGNVYGPSSSGVWDIRSGKWIPKKSQELPWPSKLWEHPNLNRPGGKLIR